MYLLYLIIYSVIISSNDISHYTLVQPCVPNPCVNGGNCEVENENGEFKCYCKPGYEGDTCEFSRLIYVVRLLPQIDFIIYSVL